MADVSDKAPVDAALRSLWRPSAIIAAEVCDILREFATLDEFSIQHGDEVRFVKDEPTDQNPNPPVQTMVDTNEPKSTPITWKLGFVGRPYPPKKADAP